MDSTGYRENERDNTIETPGVNWGGEITRLAKFDNVEVWYVKSGTHFAGRGKQAYHSSQLFLCHVYRHYYDRPPNGKPEYGNRAVILLKMEPGHKWKMLRKAFAQVAQDLAPLPLVPEYNGQGLTPDSAKEVEESLRMRVLELAKLPKNFGGRSML